MVTSPMRSSATGRTLDQYFTMLYQFIIHTYVGMTHYHYFTSNLQLNIMSNYQSIPGLLHLRTSCGFHVRQRHQGLGLPSGMRWPFCCCMVNQCARSAQIQNIWQFVLWLLVDNPIIQQSYQLAPFLSILSNITDIGYDTQKRVQLLVHWISK